MLTGLLVACTLMSWFGGRVAKAKAQALLYQSQAARHVESAEVVAYEPRPETADLLIKSGEHEPVEENSGARLPDPPAYLALRRALGDAASELGTRAEELGAMVFLHELRTDAGTRRIVAVRFLPWAIDSKAGLPAAGLVAHVFEPGGWLSRPRWVGTSRAPLLVPQREAEHELLGLADGGMGGSSAKRFRDGIRWFAGQPDLFDPSHFTLDFELADGSRGTVDGYLAGDGGGVRMNVRPDAEAKSAGPAAEAARLTGVSLDGPV